MITCPKCGQVTEVHDIGNGVLAGGFHNCVERKPPPYLTEAYDKAIQKIKELEAELADWKARNEFTQIGKLEAKVTILRKAIEPFANEFERVRKLKEIMKPEFYENFEAAKRAWEDNV